MNRLFNTYPSTEEISKDLWDNTKSMNLEELRTHKGNKITIFKLVHLRKDDSTRYYSEQVRIFDVKEYTDGSGKVEFGNLSYKSRLKYYSDFNNQGCILNDKDTGNIRVKFVCI